jgi:DNA-binding Lrp family transcriptional regulator
MDNLDIKILLALQDGIPIVRDPYATVADHLGIKPEEVVVRLRKLREQNVIRKFGVFIWKRKVGIIANALIVWAIPSNRIQEVAEFFSEFKEVTHCYERRTVPSRWRYNLYTVIHGFSRGTVREFVKTLAKKVGVDDYLILFSVKEYVRRSSGRLRPRDRNMLACTLGPTYRPTGPKTVNDIRRKKSGRHAKRASSRAT